jgi:hypothetical protein
MTTPKFTPGRLTGAWRLGFAQDIHALSSEFIGHDEHGHLRFNNAYSEVGELLYQLKSRGDKLRSPADRRARKLGEHPHVRSSILFSSRASH